MNKKIKTFKTIQLLPFSFIFQFLLYQIIKTQDTSFLFFTSLALDSGNILLLKENSIETYDSINFGFVKQLLDFSREGNFINNYNDFEFIDIKQFASNQGSVILCRIYGLFYLFKEKNPNALGTFSIDNKKRMSIIVHKCKKENNCADHYCSFIGSFISDDYSLIIQKYKLYDKKTNNDIIFQEFSFNYVPKNSNNETIKISSNNVENDLFYLESDIYFDETITCFYAVNSFNNLYELMVSVFYMDETYTGIYYEFSNSVPIENAKDIKIAKSIDMTNGFICYSFNYTIHCLIYNIEKNEFSLDVEVLKNCTGYYHDFNVLNNSFDKEYVVYCNRDNFTIQAIIFDSDFNNKILDDEKNECIIISEIDKELDVCKEKYSSSIEYIKSKSAYYVFVTCLNDQNKIFFQYELKQKCSQKIDTMYFHIEYYEEEEKLEEEETTESYEELEYKEQEILEEKLEEEELIENYEKSEEEELIEKEEQIEKQEKEKEEEKEEKEEEKKSTKYIINNIEFDYSEQVIKGTTNITKDEIITQFNDLIKEIEIGKQYEITGDDYDIVIHPIDDKVNGTNINFSGCEEILREKYNIPDSSILTILQMEITSKNNNTLTNKLEYAIYNSDKIKLDLSYCDNQQIIINYDINENSNLNTSLLEMFSKMGVDILNVEDSFFNDICYPYAEDTDVTLQDRLKDYFQNFSLCESNCEYDHIDLKLYQVICNCEIKTNITTENTDEGIVDMISITFKNSNFEIIKCYNLLFNSISNNIGFWLFMILTLGHIPLFVFYFLSKIKPLKNYIKTEMIKNNFIIAEGNSNPIKKSGFKFSTDNIENDIYQQQGSLKIKKKKKKKKIRILANKDPKISSIYNLLQFDGNTRRTKRNTKAQLTTPNKNQFINDKIFAKDEIKNKKMSIKDNLIKNDLNKILSHEEPKFPGYYFLINLNPSNVRKPYESKFILTNYYYSTAIKYEDRGFWRIFLICLFAKESLIHTFFFRSFLEPQPLRICLFIFAYSCDFAFNAVFYSVDKISDRYNYTGSNLYLYSLINNMTISLFSTLTCFVLKLILKYLTNSKRKIERLFREEEKHIRMKKSMDINRKRMDKLSEKLNNILDNLSIKIIIFIIIEFALMIFFTYYVGCFCAVYSETQTSWLSDSFMSFIMTNLFETLLAFFLGAIYNAAIRYKIEFLYNISIFVYDLGH